MSADVFYRTSAVATGRRDGHARSEDAEALVAGANQICPYSNATRNNRCRPDRRLNPTLERSTAMQHYTSNSRAGQSQTWLRNYYAVRFAVAALWVASAFTVARGMPHIAVAMLIAYPLWDALANYIDARSNGGLATNRTQAINAIVSIVAAIGVAAAAKAGMNAMLAVFGSWALLSGLMQLATGVRRWKTYGAQWAMILSGAQSVLAGVFMVKIAAGVQVADTLARVAPYAGFGAFYFLVSTLDLSQGVTVGVI